jgi:type 1 glutamine amidotransferase
VVGEVAALSDAPARSTAKPPRRALIVHGGWDGHAPRQVAALFESWLRDEGFNVVVCDSLESLNELSIQRFALAIPVWTMGDIAAESSAAVCDFVAAGGGLAGCHGGVCDAFRTSTHWQFLTGAQFVAHPGGDGVRYPVHISPRPHWITRGVADFVVETEQYYLHVDPAIEVLAATPVPPPDEFLEGLDEAQRREIRGPHLASGPVVMPVAWTRLWGAGRVFSCALGHAPQVLRQQEVERLVRRGFLWAARCEADA